MDCPKCKRLLQVQCKCCGSTFQTGEKPPTEKQIEAFRLVYFHGCTHKEAAERMGISRSEVTRLIGRLREARILLERLCPKKGSKWFHVKKFLTYYPTMDNVISEQF